MSELAIVFDFETTGLTLHPSAPLDKQPRAIEFGAALISLDDGSVVYEHNVLIDPGAPITDEITKITGITNELLAAEGMPFAAALPAIRGLFERATVAVAHNLPFDRDILRYELARHEVEDFPWPAREFCTVGAHRAEWGRNPRLTELYERIMGRPLAQTHRAVEDVRALVEVIQKDELWRVM